MRPTRNHVIRLGIVAALAAVSLGAAGAPPGDVAGWQTARWKMTEPQVRRAVEALGLVVMAAPGPEAALQTTAQVNGVDCDVAFHFSNDARRLEQVRVRVLDTTREEALGAHAALLRTMIDSYGPPAERMTHGTVRSTTRWDFRTTTIVLRFSTDAGVRGHPTRVSVAYFPTPAAVGRDPREEGVLLVLFRLMQEAWPP
jgi:hypothetical protein